VVNRVATGGEVVRRRPGWEPLLGRWLLGAVAVLLLAGGGIGVVRALPTGSQSADVAESEAGSDAVEATNRLSAWVSQVGYELDDYAAAIVLDRGVSASALAASLQTMLTGTNDFWLLELTDLSGRVIAASNGSGVDLSGAPWLQDLTATPRLTPINRSGTSLRWYVARLATTGSFNGVLVGALQASQVANLLSFAGGSAGATVEVVLPGGVLLYSSTMTTTLHAGLTDASMIADGALSRRANSPAVTAALSGGSGTTAWTAGGLDMVAGYDHVLLPGWVMGIVASESAGPAAGPFDWSWLLPASALVLGAVALAGLMVWRGRGSVPGPVPSGAVSPGAGLVGLGPSRYRRVAARVVTMGRRNPGPAALAGGMETAVGHRAAAASLGHHGGRRRLRGRYEILEVIGSGGEGQVLRALDHLHSRQVAIKVRCIDPGDATRRREILNEASVLLRMTPNPNASVVREDFISGDRYYLVMDWIDGTPLDRLLSEQGTPGLPLDAVLNWMGQVADVLDLLHQQSPAIVHSDVKPSNVIVSSLSAQRAVLVDFGISQRRDSADPRIRDGGAVGSPGFMAPEVLAGASPTPASDIFGLAATTYALLMGRPPRLGEPPDWTAIAGGSARALEIAFKAGLATDPDRRPRSAAAFIAAVRVAAEGAAVPRQAAAGR